ncbi:MAG: threonylcarbamoyl-AMP synthase [Parachlamydiales bacterium]|nr:threonylcarbamoyl-AMP synthase [Parachlamydiales bacterium]
MLIPINQAAAWLLQGKIVAIPTDTVYGLAVSIHNVHAIQNLYSFKKRPLDKPFVVQIATPADLYNYLIEIPYHLPKLMDKYWPGPLTIVVPVNTDLIPSIARSHLNSCAFRIPNCKPTLDLLRLSGPLLVPSANITGEEPALTAQDVENKFGSDFPVIEGESLSSNLPSTIIEYANGQWKLLREGSITWTQLLEDLKD